MKLLMKKSEINKLKDSKLFNRFSLSDLINLSNMDKLKEINENFPLKNYVELKREFIKKNSMNIIVNVYDINISKRVLKIRGADLEISFIASKHDIELLKLNLDKNIDSILVELTLRKHEENIFFVENIKPLKNLKEKNYQELLKIRKKLTTNEWKDLLFSSLNYNLLESKGILKDLLLVRLLPYLEKNYSYIELGPYSTGKTALGDFFSSSAKISSNISISELEYNLKEKREGLIYSKDVLYLDESNFSDLKKEVAIILLQILSDNQHNTRGSLLNKKIDISMVSQGNVENGIKEYKNKTIFDKFEKSFNKGAFLDRSNFFIAGWLIPSYSKIKETSDKEVIPLNILEDFFKIQREKISYFNYLENIKIKLISDQNEGRFISSVKKTISAFLKLLYPDGIIDFEMEKDELEKIISLSILGKYAIHYLTSLNKIDDRVEVFYKDKNIITIDINILFKDYIEAREDKYFKDNILEKKQLSFSDYKTKWENDNNQSLNEREYKREYEKYKIKEIPKGYEKLLDKLQDNYIKEKYIENYKIVVTYKVENYNMEIVSQELLDEQEEFFYAFFSIIILLEQFSDYYLDNDEKNFILKFIEIINNQNKNLYKLGKIGEKIQFFDNILSRIYLEQSSKLPYSGEIGEVLIKYKLDIFNNINENKENIANIKIIKKYLTEKNILDSNKVHIIKEYQSQNFLIEFINTKKENISNLLM